MEGLESAEPNHFTVDKNAKKEIVTPVENKIETCGEEACVKKEEENKEEKVEGSDEGNSEGSGEGNKEENQDVNRETKEEVDNETKELPMDTSCNAISQDTNKSETENSSLSCRETTSVVVNPQEEENKTEVTEPQSETAFEEKKDTEDKRTEEIAPQVNGDITMNGTLEEDPRDNMTPLNLSMDSKTFQDDAEKPESSAGITDNTPEVPQVEPSKRTLIPKSEPLENSDTSPLDQESLPKKSTPKLGFLSIDSMLQRPDKPSVSSPSRFPPPPITSSSTTPPSIPGDSKLNGTLGSWFSILPRMPCDDTSLLSSPTKKEEEEASSDNSFTDQFKQAASMQTAFGIAPYGIYHVPFPIMHVGQMNSFIGAYPFPGVAPIPLQTLHMNQMDQTSNVNPLLPLGNAIKIKTEQEEEDDDEEADLKAIANMQALLDQMEKAQQEPIPDGESWHDESFPPLKY